VAVNANQLLPIVALTGAGISAESGVPTFRGDGGLWRDHQVQELATPEAFASDPELVWLFYAWRRQLVRGCHPNRAHAALAQMEREVGEFTLITQNVDGLHQRAGSRLILELHGSLWRLRCAACGAHWREKTVPFDTMPPTCPSCGSVARPDVVWFGERLDPILVDQAVAAAASASTFLVVGTSGLVQPAASLPGLAKRNGARVIEFNVDATPITNLADELRRGPATHELPRWWKEVRRGRARITAS
jgi:NAD-dependent deacetylase